MGGGDVNDFSLSNKTVRTAGTAVVNDAAVLIKEEFKRKFENFEGKKFLIIHFGEKYLAQFHDQVKSVKKRLSIIASSPDLATDKVLGVPITPSNSGIDQKKIVMNIIRDWNIIQQSGDFH